MKILFISFFNGQIKSGGEMCSSRNFNSLKDLYGEENVTLFPVNRISRNRHQNALFWNIKNIFIDIFELGFGGLNRDHKKEIIFKIGELNINAVFIDSSLLGVLSRKIKKLFPSVKIVTFFHNIEYTFFIQNIFQEKRYFLAYRILLAFVCEKLAIKYSDKIIVLNKRDEVKIISLYNRVPDVIIPISLENKYHNWVNSGPNVARTGLFVGSYFFANSQGIIWFIKNVLPKVNMKLIIVGQGMENLRSDLTSEECSFIDIYSYVPDLRTYYEQTDFAILPIFLGGGMKVKTAEALMFGKFLIGTKEAFVGYEINHEVGICCDTAEEMITAINNFNNDSKYNDASRQLFLNQYSFEATLDKFKHLMITLDKNT